MIPTGRVLSEHDSARPNTQPRPPCPAPWSLRPRRICHLSPGPEISSCRRRSVAAHARTSRRGCPVWGPDLPATPVNWRIAMYPPAHPSGAGRIDDVHRAGHAPRETDQPTAYNSNCRSIVDGVEPAEALMIIGRQASNASKSRGSRPNNSREDPLEHHPLAARGRYATAAVQDQQLAHLQVVAVMACSTAAHQGAVHSDGDVDDAREGPGSAMQSAPSYR